MKITPGSVVFASSPLLVLLSLLSAYFLHPYLAIGVMFASAIILFRLSNMAEAKGTARIVGYSCAFACLLLIAALPSGEIGAKPCPDARVGFPGDGAPMLKYFYSPFCPYCPAQESEISRSQYYSESFQVEKYDIRYCKNDAEKFGFSATPCIAMVGKNATIKRCGLVGKEDIARMAIEAS